MINRLYFKFSRLYSTATSVAVLPEIQPKAKSAIRRPPLESQMHKQSLSCVAYCTARQYDLNAISKLFPSDKIRLTKEYLSYHPSDQSEFFFFKDGCLSSWNNQNQQIQSILKSIQPHQIHPFEYIDIEEMKYFQNPLEHTGIKGEDLIINIEKPEDAYFSKLAFSHGLCRSTQLGVLEQHLEKFLESIENIPLHMMEGREPPLSRSDVMRKHGQLLYIGGLLNLHSELVDQAPEFYWTKSELGKYFEQICKTLDITPRIRVLNQRLDHANQLIDLMKDHLVKKHETRMEIIIIALIAVEVLFETVHYLDTLKYVDLFELLGNSGDFWFSHRK